MKIRDLLDALRARAGSDRKAAATLGVSQQAMNRWRMGYAKPDDEGARKIAAELQLDHAYVLAIIHAERAETAATRATWNRIADAFGKAATVAALVIGAATLGAPSPARAMSHNQNCAQPEYTLRNNRRRSGLSTIAS